MRSSEVCFDKRTPAPFQLTELSVKASAYLLFSSTPLLISLYYARSFTVCKEQIYDFIQNFETFSMIKRYLCNERGGGTFVNRKHPWILVILLSLLLAACSESGSSSSGEEGSVDTDVETHEFVTKVESFETEPYSYDRGGFQNFLTDVETYYEDEIFDDYLNFPTLSLDYMTFDFDGYGDTSITQTFAEDVFVDTTIAAPTFEESFSGEDFEKVDIAGREMHTKETDYGEIVYYWYEGDLQYYLSIGEGGQEEGMEAEQILKEAEKSHFAGKISGEVLDEVVQADDFPTPAPPEGSKPIYDIFLEYWPGQEIEYNYEYGKFAHYVRTTDSRMEVTTDYYDEVLTVEGDGEQVDIGVLYEDGDVYVEFLYGDLQYMLEYGETTIKNESERPDEEEILENMREIAAAIVEAN